MGGEDEGKTYDISPPHKGREGYIHVDVNVHDREGNVVEKLTHVYAVFDGDSKTVNYYDAETGSIEVVHHGTTQSYTLAVPHPQIQDLQNQVPQNPPIPMSQNK